MNSGKSVTSNTASKFLTEKTNSFFYGNYAVVEGEINSSFTVSFVNLIDLTQIENYRRGFPVDQRPTYTAFVAKAVADAMELHPYANRRFYRPFGFLPRRFQKFLGVDIAVASEVNIPGIEYVAFFDIIRGVEKLGLGQIAQWLQNFRNEGENNLQWQTYSTMISKIPKLLGRLLVRLPVYFPSMWAKYRGGAVLISSPAKYGVENIIATWPSPIGVSFGLVKDRVIAKNGLPTVAPTFHLTLNFDRRLMAGAAAAKFFNCIVKNLENAARIASWINVPEVDLDYPTLS